MENVIQFEHANISIEGNIIVSDVSFEVKPGEFVYIIGKTGSGKSSLLRSLYGACKVDGGVATVSDFNLANLKSTQIPMLRRKIGVVFQDFQLLQDHTIAQNLFLVLKATGWKKKAAEKRIDEVLVEVGLIHTKDKMPSQLSGGEQQKIVVARALLNNPAIILADEPTGNLDPETANEIMQLLLRINREHNTVVVMATHFYHIIAKYPSRILKCEGNSLTEQSGLVMS
jgi:cell division transport system ATP-binding protein